MMAYQYAKLIEQGSIHFDVIPYEWKNKVAAILVKDNRSNLVSDWRYVGIPKIEEFE